MECGSGRSKAGRRDDDSTPPPLTPETEGSSPWATRKIVGFRFVLMGETRKCTLMSEPVDATTFWSVIAGLTTAGSTAIGWVVRTNSSAVRDLAISNKAAIAELKEAQQSTHKLMSDLRVTVAGQPTRAELSETKREILDAITERRQAGRGHSD